MATVSTSDDELLLKRSSYAWLRERDIDLLLCAELHAPGALRHKFEEVLGVGDATFEGAWVSLAELEGENDLVISWFAPGGRIIALVENKIAAEFQPDQGERYAQRAVRWAGTPGVDRVETVLIGPSDYFHRAGADHFGHHLSYEALTESLGNDVDPRAAFLARALTAGIAAYRTGYVPIVDDQVSEVWQEYYSLCKTVSAPLRMAPPGDKPGRSVWIYFREAEGLMADREKAVIVLKADRGYADLQFRGKTVGELEELAGPLLEPSMAIARASRSASIRIEVTEVDFRSELGDQIDAMTAGLRACERLRQFYLSHRKRFQPGS